MSATPGYADLADALTRLGAQEEPASYHGILCGALCVHDAGEIDVLELLRGEGRGAVADAPAETTLRDVCGQAAAALSSGELGFTPMLPDDDDQLGARVHALTAWCEGFLYGLTIRPGLDLRACSPEMRELVRDFTEFTRAGMDADADAESEETAYTELVEYIRVGVQLIFMELHARAPDEGQTLH